MKFNFEHFGYKKYLAGSLVIGIAQSADSLVALASIQNNFTLAFSLIELGWFLSSLFFLLVFWQKKLSLLLPGLYIGYYLFGWFYGSYLVATMEPSEVLLMPPGYMLFAGLFGIVFFSCSLYFYRIWRFVPNS